MVNLKNCWPVQVYNLRNFEPVHVEGKYCYKGCIGKYYFNCTVTGTFKIANMQAFLTPDNFLVFILEEVPRIGGFICFLKTLTKLKAGSEILPHSPKEEFHPVIKKI